MNLQEIENDIPEAAEQIQELIDRDGYPEDAIMAYIENVGLDYALETFEEAYMGEWDSEKDYAENLAEDMGWFSTMSENGIPDYYFDTESFARDLFIGDYCFLNGYVFLNM